MAIVSGALGNKPFNGGNAWSRLSWVTGFRRLGFNVVFVEQIEPEHCVDADGAPAPFAQSANRAYFKATMDRFGLSASCALLCGNGRSGYGLSLADLESRADQADLLFNLSGHLTIPELVGRIDCKVYYDDDPGFTQIWQATGGAGPRLEGHRHYLTLGANIGAPDCTIPTVGIHWRHTRPPVVLDDWPAQPVGAFDRMTTVASWRGAFGPVQYRGKAYGLKAHEFRKVFELPRRSGRPFELALHIHPAETRDLEALHTHGWRIVDPRTVADTPDAFRRYVQTSGAEFSVAQGVYGETNSGWFSDRTVRYLASGRPALVQETGFSRHVPTGEGLLSFRTLDEAVEGVERIAGDYERHCRAARRVAEEYFASDKVIGRMMAGIGLDTP